MVDSPHSVHATTCGATSASWARRFFFFECDVLRLGTAM
jgi:hypothetical protein